MKLRRNTKPKRVQTNKYKLGTSIEERLQSILTREEFGHWEIDTVIGTKDKNDTVLLTLAERQTRYYMVRKIASKTAVEVQMNSQISKNILVPASIKYSKVLLAIMVFST